MALLEVRGARRWSARLKVGSRRFEKEVAQGLVDAAEYSQGYMKERKLSGSPVGVVTGRLRGGWTVPRPRLVTSNVIEAGFGTKVRYARVQNYGFAGPVQVKAHTRRLRAGGGSKRKGRGPTGRRLLGKARASAEKKTRTELSTRRQNQSLRSHGLSVSAKQKSSREYRRATGQQAGVSAPHSLIQEKARKGGLIAVSAHGRYMKIQGKHYVESTLRETKDTAVKLVMRRIRIALPTSGGV